mmetsp:Transcript_17688/g.62892  ORF Transcript_17688/g.62892 Transcript_17688/m.62892 type:complete len:302 (-) Transcript_17688:21-926(-)
MHGWLPPRRNQRLRRGRQGRRREALARIATPGLGRVSSQRAHGEPYDARRDGPQLRPYARARRPEQERGSGLLRRGPRRRRGAGALLLRRCLHADGFRDGAQAAPGPRRRLRQGAAFRAAVVLLLRPAAVLARLRLLHKRAAAVPVGALRQGVLQNHRRRGRKRRRGRVRSVARPLRRPARRRPAELPLRRRVRRDVWQRRIPPRQFHIDALRRHPRGRRPPRVPRRACFSSVKVFSHRGPGAHLPAARIKTRPGLLPRRFRRRHVLARRLQESPPPELRRGRYGKRHCGARPPAPALVLV